MMKTTTTHFTVRTTRPPLAALAMAAVVGAGALALAVQAGADPTAAQATAYSQCMRANGVADFPNPNAEGHIAYGGISVPPAVWIAAVGACKDLQPAGWNDVGRNPAQQAAALTFAQCVRDNGVPDFPDPATPRDPLIDTTKMAGDRNARDIPGLEQATDGPCQDLMQAALPPLGTGHPG